MPLRRRAGNPERYRQIVAGGSEGEWGGKRVLDLMCLDRRGRHEVGSDGGGGEKMRPEESFPGTIVMGRSRAEDRQKDPHQGAKNDPRVARLEVEALHREESVAFAKGEQAHQRLTNTPNQEEKSTAVDPGAPVLLLPLPSEAQRLDHDASRHGYRMRLRAASEISSFSFTLAT